MRARGAESKGSHKLVSRPEQQVRAVAHVCACERGTVA